MPDSFKVFESFFPSFDGTKIHYRFFENKKSRITKCDFNEQQTNHTQKLLKDGIIETSTT